jgi:DNA-binding winged helix-turn-helix (wHTH) protein
MDAPVAHDVFLFGGFRLDRHSGGLFRQDGAGGATRLAIGPRALDVLAVLVAHPGELVPKQAIMQAVWPSITVDEKNLTVQISTLRRVLDDGQTQGCSTLSIEFPVEERIGSGESGSISILTEC